MFYFLPWKIRHNSDGIYRSAEGPENWHMDVLTFGDRANYFVAKCSPKDGVWSALPKSFERVSERLEFLLEASLKYLPALALAREKLENRERNFSSKEEYSELLCNEIESFINNQSTAPYFLAKANVGSHIGYLSKGQYTWIVAHYPDKNEVLWITGDYMIYNDPLENFDIGDAQLQKLPKVKSKRS